MYFQSTVVVNKTESSEFVHEEVHPGAGGTNHLRQRLLAHQRNHGLGRVILSEASQYEKRSCEPFFAGIEQLIH